ncbi:MAG: hypothetical protein ACFFDC_13235 [Promethearchaeota archaeon]
MKKKLSVLVLSVFILMLLPAMSGSAKKPLVGTMSLEYNLLWPGYQAEIPDWIGTITLDTDGDGINEEYGMVFFCIGTGKPFDTDVRGNVVFFGEIWVIYDWVTFDFSNEDFEHGDVVLLGTDEGTVSLKNSKYRMNGVVTETNDECSKWLGRSVHMKGIIEWYDFGAPHYAPGTFRIN